MGMEPRLAPPPPLLILFMVGRPPATIVDVEFVEIDLPLLTLPVPNKLAAPGLIGTAPT